MESFVPTNKLYSDLTGKFVCRSFRGNQYLLIIYDYDSNTILQEPLKNRTAGEIKCAWSFIHAKPSAAGVAPSLYILDNEISTELKTKIEKNNIQFQLVPPHIHHRNAAERAIQTFKHHFLCTLATCDKNYPLAEWDRLLVQAEIMLSLLIQNYQLMPMFLASSILIKLLWHHLV